jgi:ubiquinone/menaquinone biosynthesis C-methylase UbiE
MKTYQFRLYDKQEKYLIDSISIENCKDRDEALSKVKRLMLSQGLILSRYGYTLKNKD